MRNLVALYKKTIAALLIAMLIFGLTACGNSDQSGSELQFDLTAIDVSNVVENESSTSFVAVAENGIPSATVRVTRK